MPVIPMLAQRFAGLAAVGAIALTILSLRATAASEQALDVAADRPALDDRVDAGIAGNAAAASIVAQFTIGRQIATDDASSDAPPPSLIVRATRFNQASAAARYLDETVVTLRDDPAPYDRVDPILADDMPSCGDAAFGYAYACSMPDQGTSDGVAILFQQGQVVYELELEGVAAPDMTVIDAVVQDILDCAQGACKTTGNASNLPTEEIDEQALLGRKRG